MLYRPSLLIAMMALTFFATTRSAEAQLGTLAARAKVSAVLNVDELRPGQQAVLAVVTDLPQGFHAVSSLKTEDNLPFEVTFDPDPRVRTFAPIYPPGHDETYAALGKLNIYTGRVVTYIPMQVPANAQTGPIALSGSATLQMCNDKVCFPPATLKFEIKTEIVDLSGTPTTAPSSPIDPTKRTELFKGFDPAVFSTLLSAPDSPTTQSAATQPSDAAHAPLTTFSFLGSIFTALGAGLILNVMPCVLPVLPLKAMGFYQSAGQSRTRSLMFGTAFAAGIVAAFGVLAILVVVFKQSWGELFSYAWFTWALVAILVIFGLVQITGKSLPLPAGLYNVTFAHDTIGGNFNFGAFTALLSTPCTGPLFPPLLAVAATLPVWLAVAIIMTVGLGMSLPYIILSAFPNVARNFPRTGPWAELVKQMMGCLLLAVAAYFAGQKLIPSEKFWWVVFAAIATSAVFLIVRTAMLMPRARPIGIAAVVSLLLTGSALGVTLRLTDNPQLFIAYSDEAFAKARATNDIVLVKFTANWCANCKYIEGTVFHDPATIKALRGRNVRMIKADLTNRDAPGWPLLKRLSASGGIPLTAIYSPGKPEPAATLESIYTSSTLLQTIDQAK